MDEMEERITGKRSISSPDIIMCGIFDNYPFFQLSNLLGEIHKFKLVTDFQMIKNIDTFLVQIIFSSKFNNF